MRRFIHFFKFIAMGSFSLILTACYGVMYGVPYLIKDGKVTVRDNTGNPIPGLSIKVFNSSVPDSYEEEEMTDNGGEAYFQIEGDLDNEYGLEIKDIDGTENFGLFETKTITFIPDDFSSVIDLNVAVDESE